MNKESIMRSFLRPVALLGAVLLITSCDGMWVEYTFLGEINKAFQIRQEGASADWANNINFNDLTDLTSDFPAGAEILSMEITNLSVSVNVLATTTADSVKYQFGLEDDSGRILPITGEGTIKECFPLAGCSKLSPRLLNALAAVGVNTRLGEFKSRLNLMLVAATDPDGGPLISIGSGFYIETFGGQFDADLTINISIHVVYRDCEQLGSLIASSELGECTVGID